jgi:hypothetical protein
LASRTRSRCCRDRSSRRPTRSSTDLPAHGVWFWAGIHDRAIGILRRERAALDAIAQALAGRRHLAGDEIRRLFAENSNPREKPESC